jgi:hypothetical protein
VDKSHLPVGMGDFAVHVSSTARLTEARPNAKTRITNILVVFILLAFLFEWFIIHFPGSRPSESNALLLLAGKLEQSNDSIESFFENWYNLHNIC